jgi:hypothetical protein
LYSLFAVSVSNKEKSFITSAKVTFVGLAATRPTPEVPVQVANGWQFYANGAVVPVDTYEVQVAILQKLFFLSLWQDELAGSCYKTF